MRCRTCKHSLIFAILSYNFIETISNDLEMRSKYITARRFCDTWRGQAVQHHSQPKEPTLAEGEDTTIWLNVVHGGGSTRLVVSPDTAVILVLPIMAQNIEMDKISKISSNDTYFKKHNWNHSTLI